MSVVLFEVRVAQPGAGAAKLAIEAESAATAVAGARAKGYVVLDRATPAAAARRRGRFSLVLFSQELLALLGAGLSLIEGLETLAEKEQAAAGGHVLKSLLEGLYEGVPFSEAMGRQPQVFPALFVATVRASEKTGDLGEALGRYVAYETQFDVVRKKVITASVYPLLLIGVGGLVVLFLLVYVVPRFSLVFADSVGQLPLASRLLLQWGTLVSERGGELLGAAAVAVAATVAVAAVATAVTAATAATSVCSRAACSRAACSRAWFRASRRSSATVDFAATSIQSILPSSRDAVAWPRSRVRNTGARARIWCSDSRPA
ncbi:MAG TPA: type II secretion system F family protein [Rhodocyclaceae bacterium]|nr:type II secretion system F family protein [Rhodocyclaceae bacterium]